MDLAAVDLGIETEIEVLQGALLAEVCALFSSTEGALGTNVQFVLKEEFEELCMAELVAGSFLQTHFEASKKP